MRISDWSSDVCSSDLRIVDQKSSGEQEGQSTQKPVALLDQQRDSQTGEAVENHLEGQAPRGGSELFRMPEKIGKSEACEDGGPVVEIGIGEIGRAHV